MEKVHNIPQLLNAIRDGHKYYPKAVGTRALKFQSDIRKYGLYPTVKYMLHNAMTHNQDDVVRLTKDIYYMIKSSAINNHYDTLETMDRVIGKKTICEDDFKRV
jgi:hypothetical protein